MASSNIKLFDENKGNMLSDSEFSISNQRMNGLQTGVASSQLQNKAMYQASLVAYAIAQIMMQNGLNANDTDAVSAFVANLSGTMLQKVYDLATTAEAQAGVATGKWMSPALVKAAIDKTLTDKNYLPKSGGTMTGNLILNANPTANLGAATKQYVDNAKTALTPVFGDLAKDGWFKLGDMSLNSAIEDAYKGFVYNDLHSFLVNNMAKLSFLLVRLVNNTWKNTSDAAYNVQIGNSYYAGIFKVYPNTSANFSRIAIYTIGPLDYAAVSYSTITSVTLIPLFYQSDSIHCAVIDDHTDESKALYVRGSDTSVRLVSGTAEIWYK